MSGRRKDDALSEETASRAAASLDGDLAGRIRDVARFLLPHDALVGVAGLDGAGIDLTGKRVWRFPNSDSQAASTDWTDLIGQVEMLRGRSGFLLFPATTMPWLEQQPELRRYLERQGRVALHRDDTCIVYALDRRMPGAYEAPDGIPVPPRELIGLVSGGYDPKFFYESGAVAVDYMTALTGRAGMFASDLGAILDFGCGCGRVIRHWRQPRGATLRGTDYNPYLVAWCREHIRGPEFQANDLGPPLGYDDESFDFVYSISAFTHLDADLQLAWMDELKRVTKRGGMILITVHGEDRIETLDGEARERFSAGELVVWRPEEAGTNLCAAYHPESYVRESLSRGMTVIDYLPGAAVDVKQDVVLFQKASNGSVSRS
jgi:SAM-dependent methyltransferase